MIKKTRPLINSGNLDLTLTSNPGYLHPKHKPDRNGITRAQRIHGELRAVSEIPNAHAPCFQAIYKPGDVYLNSKKKRETRSGEEGKRDIDRREREDLADREYGTPMRGPPEHMNGVSQRSNRYTGEQDLEGLRYEDTPYPGEWMDPIVPNPVVQALTDPSLGPTSLAPSHPALIPRDPEWAMQAMSVGVADRLVTEEVIASIPGSRWSNRGVDAMFGTSLQAAYELKYRQKWATHMTRLQGTPRGPPWTQPTAPEGPLMSAWPRIAQAL